MLDTTTNIQQVKEPVPRNVLIRDLICAALFWAAFAVQFLESIEDPAKKYITIGLLVVLAAVLPVRSSFRHVFAKLGLIKDADP